MSEKNIREILLHAVEHLKAQYQLAGTPCLALMISRQYRLLKNTTDDPVRRKNDTVHARTWLYCYINHSCHSGQLRKHLNDVAALGELNFGETRV